MTLGYRILARNYRYKRAEIDMIVSTEDLLLFVEVKYRKSERYGHPEAFVSPNQQSLILSAAAHYLEETRWPKAIRFDVFSVNAENKITHFEDAFH
ncbi:hypothetical protein BFP72_15500 [Reichenbachiella sp. 5M10]|nr:hypothetical protein BFP72_15500 [Reichenbachiella sp. 5M10]